MFGSHRATSLEERAIAGLPFGSWQGDDALPSYAGKHVTNSSALQLLTVYGCNDFICEGISTLPIDAFRDLGDGSTEEIKKPGWLDQPTVDLDFVSWCTQVLT